MQPDTHSTPTMLKPQLWLACFHSLLYELVPSTGPRTLETPSKQLSPKAPKSIVLHSPCIIIYPSLPHPPQGQTLHGQCSAMTPCHGQVVQGTLQPTPVPRLHRGFSFSFLFVQSGSGLAHSAQTPPSTVSRRKPAREENQTASDQ